MNQNVIYELLQDRAKCAPNATAVIDEQRSLTRMELEQLIDTIAVKIPSGAGRVGIMMEHTVEMIAAIFAVLKVGKAYVPVEPFFQPKISPAFSLIPEWEWNAFLLIHLLHRTALPIFYIPRARQARPKGSQCEIEMSATM